MLIGEKVKLVAIQEKYISTIEEWFNDVEFMRNYDFAPAIPRNSKNIYDLIGSFQDTEERYLFAIALKSSGEVIGIAGFDEIVWSNGTAMIFIGIGSKGYTGQGLGKEALSLLLDFGYNELNFHVIYLNVIGYNNKAIKLYEGAGFKREGVYREFIKRDGKRYDMYLYGMLNSDWKNNGKKTSDL
jgi:RimJ/RimL family protein N-acetyltransferase